jgi:dipeptidyl aminopeptidase/acylaminoacyl peptidase
VKPTDLDHLAIPSDPQLHPDGTRVVYVLTEVDVADDRYVRTLHLWDGAGTRRFTHGPGDTLPRWSPDGRWLAFLRKGTEDGARSQLHVMAVDGGEPQRRTDLPLGVTDLVWSPDSAQVVVVAPAYVPAVADLDDDERRRRPRRITRLPYRTDGQGWIHDRRDHLWLVVVAEDTDPRCLTPGDRDASAPVWRPDGAAIAFLTEPDGWPDTEPHTQPFELDLLGGGLTPLAAPGMWSLVHYAPDGRVFLTGLTDPMDWPGTPQIWLRRGRTDEPGPARVAHRAPRP